MATLIARNDALIVAQVTTITPTVTNSAVYDLKINTKQEASYTADGSATAQEIVEGLQTILAASVITEFLEATWTENNTTIIATGGATGKPFTVIDGSGSGTWASITTGTSAKSPNHWIAENFDTGSLPVSTDTVILANLTSSQSFKWGLDHNAVVLDVLRIAASCSAEIGLPQFNVDSTSYYQGAYRDTHLKISAAALTIGEGSGNGSSRINLNLGTNACAATIISTSANSPSGENGAPVHLIGAHASNSIQLINGRVDIGMFPGTGASCTWPTVIASGGTLRFGEGCTLTTVEAAGNSYVEIRSALTTLRTRDNGSVLYYGSGNVTTMDIAGGKVEVQATGTLTIATLNGYGGKELDLTNCDSVVTITNATIYGTPSSPFTVRDPNNKLAMTNAASTPNGAQSLVVITGSGKNVRVT